MNTPKVLPIVEKYKNQIEKTFKFVEDIIYVRLENDDTKNEWKYVLISLDEAERNFKNNRYFNVRDLLDFIENFYGKDNIIYNRINEINIDAEIYFREIIDNYGKYEYLDKIVRHPDLFEELVNYILAGEKFENELINLEGFTVKNVQERTHLTVKQIYTFFIDIKEKKKFAVDDLEAVIEIQNVPF